MKKLLLFLSLCATSCIYGVEEEAVEVKLIKKNLKAIDAAFLRLPPEGLPPAGYWEMCADMIMCVPINIIESNFELCAQQRLKKLSFVANSDAEQVANVVQTIIEHIARRVPTRSLVGLYAAAFGTLCLYVEEVYLEKLLKNCKFSKEVKDYIKALLHAFCASLIINYYIFIRVRGQLWNIFNEKRDTDLRSETFLKEIQSIINTIYKNVKFDSLSVWIISNSCRKIWDGFKSAKQEQLTWVNNDLPSCDYNWNYCIEPSLDRIRDCVLETHNTDYYFQKFQNKKMAIDLVSLGVIGGSGYYIGEKTKDGKMLKKWARENPKKAATLGGLATLIIGGAAISSMASVIRQ